MARCLIIGCGCRGRALTAELRRQGNVVRGTTRDPGSVAAIEAAGAEPHVGDPDRLATLFPALDHVSVAYILLGSATGSPAAVAALHGERLESLVFKMVDTTIRVVVYEAAGSVDPAVLASGAAIVRRLAEENRMLYEILTADPADADEWVAAAAGAMAAALRS
jgi:Trk K+ transport system NAD-binding subunit